MIKMTLVFCLCDTLKGRLGICRYDLAQLDRVYKDVVLILAFFELDSSLFVKALAIEVIAPIYLEQREDLTVSKLAHALFEHHLLRLKNVKPCEPDIFPVILNVVHELIIFAYLWLQFCSTNSLFEMICELDVETRRECYSCQSEAKLDVIFIDCDTLLDTTILVFKKFAETLKHGNVIFAR